MKNNGRIYTVVKIMPDGRRAPVKGLTPMTHREAMTFRSKMMRPAMWRLEEIRAHVIARATQTP